MVSIFLFCLIRAIRVIRGSLFLFPGYRLHLRQQIPELAVVYLNPVIQIKDAPLVSVVP